VEGVLVNSFPKSGTHVLTKIMEMVGYAQTKTHISRSLIMYGQRNMIRNIRIYRRIDKDQLSGLNIDLENQHRRIKEPWLRNHLNKYLSEKVYSQAHVPFSIELEAVFLGMGLKSLYIHRDPKDVLVSLKNYILKLKRHPNHKMLVSLKSNEKRLETLICGFNRGSNIDLLSPFAEKFARSIKWSSSPFTCSVEFEKIIGPKGGGSKAEQKKELLKILSYLGCDERVRENMSDKIFDRKSETFHKGLIGQWEKEFTPNILDLFNEKFRQIHKVGS